MMVVSDIVVCKTNSNKRVSSAPQPRESPATVLVISVDAAASCLIMALRRTCLLRPTVGYQGRNIALHTWWGGGPPTCPHAAGHFMLPHASKSGATRHHLVQHHTHGIHIHRRATGRTWVYQHLR